MAGILHPADTSRQVLNTHSKMVHGAKEGDDYMVIALLSYIFITIL